MVYHSYALNVLGHEASRVSTDALCALRSALHRVENPVSDVVVLVTHDDDGGNGSSDVASRVFTEMELQRPAGVTTAYTLVQWPSFLRTPDSLSSSYNHNQRDPHVRFQRLFADINRTMEATNFDTAVADSLKMKCEAYMKDIERLVGYGREASPRLSDSLKQSMMALDVAIDNSTSVTANELTFLHNKLLHKDNSPVNAELQIIMNHLETSRTTSGHGSTSVHREAQRNWLVLSFLIGSIVNQALQRRADRIGSVWVHHFIADLMRHSGRAVRFHLLGNGRGCEVALAAAGAVSGPFDRKIHSVFLTQATCSSRCISAKSKYERMAGNAKNSPIAGPILATVSGMGAQLHGHDVCDDESTLSAAGFVGLSTRKVSNIHVQIGKMEDDKRNKHGNEIIMQAGKIYNLHIAGLAASKDTSIGNTYTHVVASHPEVIALFWKAAQVKTKTIAEPDTGRRSKWAVFMARWKALRL